MLVKKCGETCKYRLDCRWPSSSRMAHRLRQISTIFRQVETHWHTDGQNKLILKQTNQIYLVISDVIYSRKICRTHSGRRQQTTLLPKKSNCWTNLQQARTCKENLRLKNARETTLQWWAAKGQWKLPRGRLGALRRKKMPMVILCLRNCLGSFQLCAYLVTKY